MSVVKKSAVRIASVAAAAAAAVGLFSTGAANADTFVPLPGAELHHTLPNGLGVTARIAHESALINPSMGSTPLHRNAWVSASAQVEVHGKHNGTKITPGYVVGCQVDISGGGANGGADVTSDYAGENVTGKLSTGGNLTLGPGQATSFLLLDIEKPDAYGNEGHQFATKFNGPNGSVTWTDSTIGLNGCGGYAQARAFVRVEVATDNGTSEFRVWGQPFSLG
ncbi:MspA family porin [Nocardia speluncae]|uniref:MspA family porin n=1 Tax=Nocardia speluncae TaxID=419477 RepID=A0A846XMT6_9NOCA|nr:MspA family porin [Nocardia speluncae]NKY36897.1 MspA family porin [Nocardia speluncae]